MPRHIHDLSLPKSFWSTIVPKLSPTGTMILLYLIAHEGQVVTQAQIGDALNISRWTVGRESNRLFDQGYIVETTDRRGGIQPIGMQYELSEDLAYLTELRDINSYARRHAG